jgi:predicted glycogen debranching enzyme
MILDFGREVCGNLAVAERREWLVTNGIGGFASGTVASVLTRRYHGLLIAALQPPLGRTLLLAKLDETAEYDGIYPESGRLFPLYVNRWEEGPVEPNGHYHLNRFHLEGTTPVWTYACANALLEKRIWMEQGANTTYIHYRLVRGTGPMSLSIKAFANYRDYHSTTIVNDWQPAIEQEANGLAIRMFADAHPFYLLAERAQITPQTDWYEDFFLSLEDERGMNDVAEDHLYIAQVQTTLRPGEAFTLVASTNPAPVLDGATAYRTQREYERDLLELTGSLHGKGSKGSLPQALQQLVLAADQFVVQRPAPLDPAGKSIIAGYPWFSDWGRDTMVALPGLTLATGRPKIAASILRTYGHYVDQGMLPNRFPDAGEDPEYNTVDATLWYFVAIREYYSATGDTLLLRELFPVLADIIAWHRRGTRYNIHVDPADGLLFAGEEGVQLTWMDVKIQEWVVTPRTGKPVEVNALWYNALRIMHDFAEHLGEDTADYAALAAQARQGFNRFWYEEMGYCYDVIDTPSGAADGSLRPNQLLAISLPHPLLTAEQQRSVVDACARHLLTAHGLRTLSPDDQAFIGVYGGDLRKRESAYHQGTVWAWLIGHFVTAHLRVYKDMALARTYLTPLLHHLADYGVGSISEIFDGNPPFTPRGCIAQAWSVAEVLRAWQMTEVRGE